MRNTPTQDQINHRKDVWQAIKWRMNAHKITPEELAYQTQYSKDLIERGIGGEAAPITSPFLHGCVKVFCSIESRTLPYGDTFDMLSDDDLEALLKPPPAMPPRQGNFWEWDDRSDS